MLLTSGFLPVQLSGDVILPLEPLTTIYPSKMFAYFTHYIQIAEPDGLLNLLLFP